MLIYAYKNYANQDNGLRYYIYTVIYLSNWISVLGDYEEQKD